MSRRSLLLMSSFALVLFALAALGCGGAKGAENPVTGKVTAGGKAVTGQLVFVGGDKKETAAVITPEGTYTVNLPKGEYQILVKGMPGPAAPPVGAKAPPSDAPAVQGQKGEPPPAKYAQANNGLKLTVNGGEQTHDIDLK